MKNFPTQWEIEEENQKTGGGVQLIDREHSEDILLLDGEHGGNVLLIGKNSQNWKIILNVYLFQSSQNWKMMLNVQFSRKSQSL